MTPDIADLMIGQRVRYQPAHYADHEAENGIIKDIRAGLADRVWVVYKCDGNWGRYEEYTGELTMLDQLRVGWLPTDGEKT